MQVFIGKKLCKRFERILVVRSRVCLNDFHDGLIGFSFAEPQFEPGQKGLAFRRKRSFCPASKNPTFTRVFSCAKAGDTPVSAATAVIPALARNSRRLTTSVRFSRKSLYYP